MHVCSSPPIAICFGQTLRILRQRARAADGHQLTFRCMQVTCQAGGKPGDVLSVGTEPLPPALGWGEVLVNIRAAPVRSLDLSTHIVLERLCGAPLVDLLPAPCSLHNDRSR